MSDPSGPIRYQLEYEEVVKLFDSGNAHGCIKAAKHILKDLGLPRYYVIKHCIIIASALDNWDDAEIWRLVAEQAYKTGLDNAKRKRDTESLNILQDLRAELDQLIEYKKEDEAELLASIEEEFKDKTTDDEMDCCDIEDEDYDNLKGCEEDMVHIQNEKQDEVAAAMKNLAIRESADAKSTDITVGFDPTHNTISFTGKSSTSTTPY